MSQPTAQPAQPRETKQELIGVALNAALVMGFYVALGLWRGARFFWIAWAVAAALAVAYVARRFAMVRGGKAGAVSGLDVALRLGWILCSVVALALALLRI